MHTLRWSLVIALPAIFVYGCVHHHHMPEDQPLPVRVGFKHPVRAVNGLPANHPDGVVLDYAPNSKMPIALQFADPNIGELYGDILITTNTPHTRGRIVWVDPEDHLLFRKISDNGFGEVKVFQEGPDQSRRLMVQLRIGNRE